MFFVCRRTRLGSGRSKIKIGSQLTTAAPARLHVWQRARGNARALLPPKTRAARGQVLNPEKAVVPENLD
jgi:hypothetical protein